MLTDTFGIFTSSALTTEASSETTTNHYTDESDNPQKITLWLGSLDSTRIAYNASNPGVDDIVVSVTDILPAFQISHSYSLGDVVEPITPNGFRYTVTTAGTSAGAEPTWPLTIGSTVISGGVTFTLTSYKHDITEIKLAITEAGLVGATPGGTLNLGTELLGGAVEAIPIWIQIDNQVNTVTNNITVPDLRITISFLDEYDA